MTAQNHALHARSALLADGWSEQVRITLANGIIDTIESAASPQPGDEQCAVVLPGLPNLHSHAFQRGMAGLAETRGPSADSFWTWRETMYRFVDRIDPDALEAIAALAYVEMLESGFTRVGEFHYLHHDVDGLPFDNPARMAEALASAAADTGIALTLLPVFYAHSGFGGAVPGYSQRRFICDVDSFGRLVESSRAALRLLPDAVLGLAPHSLRAVTPEELRGLTGLMSDAPIHIHIAEQLREVEDCLAWSGARPVEWLLENVEIDAHWCLVHATHVNASEVAAIVRSGAIVGLCPITEANLGDGIFPADSFLGTGGQIGIGSDSNVLIDAAEELRLLEYGQRLTSRNRNVLSPPDGGSTGANLYRKALAGGKSALSPGASGLAAGEVADFLSLHGDHPSLCLCSRDQLIDAFIFASGRSAIDCVWRQGKKLVSNGRHEKREQVVERYRKTIGRILV